MKRFSVVLASCFWLLAVAGFAQTNSTLFATMSTNALLARLSAPTDFQRLQYYYAAQRNSPPPGREHGIFTLRADRTWSGDWNSRVVSRPTRAQLSAIPAQQVDLFHRAGVFTNGACNIATSRTNIPLPTL